MILAKNLAGFIQAVLQISAVYVYFLLFDQFGFLHHLHTLALSPTQVQAVMAAMGVSGLISSFATAKLLQRWPLRPFLFSAWTACAAAAGCSLLLKHPALLMLEGALIGVTTGSITVLVATSIRDLTPRRITGLAIGLGTGLAYGAANLPFFFNGSLRLVVGFSMLLSTTAAGMAAQSDTQSPESESEPSPAPVANGQLWPWIIGLFVLVCLDSGAFAMLQQDAQMKSWTWGPDEHKSMLGLVHLCAAVAAGLLIDRGLRFSLIGFTWLSFLFAFTMIPYGLPDAYPAALLYAGGISTYSVMLVAVPSLLGGGMLRRAHSAAWVFGISGWLGSVLGIGMAQDNAWVPSWFLAASGVLLLAGILAVRRSLVYTGATTFGRVAVGLLVCTLWLQVTSRSPSPVYANRKNPLPSAPERGREVYRREGCINCHSQYIRPESKDENIWGPYHPIDRRETPPFVGNRRQGPDLKNVGLRRSAQWQRAHLMHPQLVSPGSRMPSYAHLFRDGVTDGDDLVHYLGKLGEPVRETYLERLLVWQPEDSGTGSAENGAPLFRQFCAPCHGPRGKGDGPAASYFQPGPRDLTTGPYIKARPDQAEDGLSLLLARIIKHGLPGTSMPGHEALPDTSIMDLVHFVASLHPETDPVVP